MKASRPSHRPGPAAASAAGPRRRVLIASLSYYPERYDGSSRLAYDEARYLADLGHQVWLVAMAHHPAEPEQLRDGPLNVLRYQRPRLSAFDPTGSHQRTVRKLLRRHVGCEVDVVHGHALLPAAAAMDLYAARARLCYSLHSPVRAELLAARRGARPRERLRLRIAAAARSRLEARCLARCDVLTCDSDFTRTLVAAIHGAGIAGRMEVAPGWVDLSRFRIIDDRVGAKRSLGWPTDRPVLFCLRRFVPRMGLDRLVDAAASVTASGRLFRLVVAGDGELREALVARARALGLDETIQFPGAPPDPRLPAMFGAADAFVLPSAELECFGLIVLEALACGRPVLATPVGAIPELLGELTPEWLANDSSADAIAALLSAFLAGRLPDRPGEALRQFVAGRYSAAARLSSLVSVVLGEPEAA